MTPIKFTIDTWRMDTISQSIVSLYLEVILSKEYVFVYYNPIHLMANHNPKLLMVAHRLSWRALILIDLTKKAWEPYVGCSFCHLEALVSPSSLETSKHAEASRRICLYTDNYTHVLTICRIYISTIGIYRLLHSWRRFEIYQIPKCQERAPW